MAASLLDAPAACTMNGSSRVTWILPLGRSGCKRKGRIFCMNKAHAISHRSLPPLDLLRGFDCAARHLSFTLAAGELFLTQSAVSRQIQALEAFLGVSLFERRHKALALTEAGQAYHRAIRSE